MDPFVKQSEIEWSIFSPDLMLAVFGSRLRFMVSFPFDILILSRSMLVEHLFRSLWIFAVCGF